MPIISLVYIAGSLYATWSSPVVHGATTANDDPGAMTSGTVVETASAGIDVPVVNTSVTATDIKVAADDTPAINDLEAVNGALQLQMMSRWWVKNIILLCC